MNGSGVISMIEEISIQDVLSDHLVDIRNMNLVYISDNPEGIKRIKDGKSFYYLLGNKKVKDENTLKRIKSLVIPPAWENVWICKDENGHLQATGYDKLNRKQYRYHPQWNVISSLTKYNRLLDFGLKLTNIRKQIAKDLLLPDFPKEKILAAVVSLLELSHIRIGNRNYEKLYGSFGLTTLKNRHVSLNGQKISFRFKGKKGVFHDITLKSKRLANIIKGCKEIPGKDLFQYIDETGNINNINSGMVNEYIHLITGEDFTAKDFRTWSGSIVALEELLKLGDFSTEEQKKQNLVNTFDIVADKLGNTRAVCKKYYVHPAIIKLYEEGRLIEFINEFNISNKSHASHIFTQEETLLMHILQNS